MSLLVITLFLSSAALQNIDNFVLAAAYRLKNVVIPTSKNLLIALLSGIATGVPFVVASGLRLEAVQIGLETIAGVAGRGILMMLGIWTLVGYFRSRLFAQLRESESDDDGKQRSVPPVGQATPIGTYEAMIAGTALAVDNLAPSFAFGLINPLRQDAVLSGLFIGALTAGFSIVAVVCGQVSGRKSRPRLQRFLPAFIAPEFISGLLLIGIGVAPLDVDDWATDFLKQRLTHGGD
jgi:putative Mn2+ efflux pump MntP